MGLDGQEPGSRQRVYRDVHFRLDDFKPLVPAFNAYMDWLAGRYFDGSRARFLLFLDVMAAKGAEWPYYATYPHQLDFRAAEGMSDFDAALAAAGKSIPDKAGVLAAMKAATGKDHSGLFEFWESFGITLDPAQVQRQSQPQQHPPSRPKSQSLSPSQQPIAARQE